MNATKLLSLFDLQPGEGRTVGLTVETAFVVSAGLMIGQSAIEALFFVQHGTSDLPAMYVLLGGLMFVITLGIGSLVARTGRRRTCVGILVAVAALVVAGRLGLAADVTWITRALWLLQATGYFVLGLAVWGIAGIVSDTRQAKRFFPLIGGGSVLGFVVGGIATNPLASWLGAPNLLLVWAGALIGATILALRLLAGVPARAEARGGRSPSSMVAAVRTVWRSTLLSRLALGSALLSLLFFSLYLPFSRAATERYPDAAELAGFLGLFFGVSTGLALALSVFATGRLLTRFGVPAILLVLPALYLVGFGTLMISASFATLALVRFAQVAWMQGGATSAWEAVINTVPAGRRDQTRAFLYGGPTQVGTILAGVIALVGERTRAPRPLYAIGFGCATLAVIAMFGVRREYPRELVRALREGRPHVFGSATVGGAGPFGSAHADAAARAVAVRGLADPDVRVRRVAAIALADLDPLGSEPSLVAALHDDDGEVRAAAVSALGGHASGTEPGEIERLASDPASVVRQAVVDAAAQADWDAVDTGRILQQLLEDEDPVVRSRAAGALVARDPTSSALASLAELATSPDDEARTAAFQTIRGPGASGLRELVLAGVGDPVPAVRGAAAGAFPSVVEPTTAVQVLVAMTADRSRSVREAVGKALGSIGHAAVDPVVACLQDPRRRDGALIALEHLPARPRYPEIRRFASTTVAEAVERHQVWVGIDPGGNDRLQLLRDSVRYRSDQDALAALRAAALMGGRTEIGVAVENLLDPDPSQRANALEVIESVADRRLVRPLLQMWEHSQPADEGSSAVEGLRSDSDDWIRRCAEFTMTARGGIMETLTTLSAMERVLFLRKVALFERLPPPDLLPIASVAREVSFDRGDSIASEGEVGDEMHIIVRGEVLVMASDDEGVPRILATRSTGDVVGEMSLLTNAPRIAGLVASSPVHALSLERAGFESILRERPETALGVIRVLCGRLAEAGGRAQDDTSGTTGTTTAST